jgi:hypothetical protein
MKLMFLALLPRYWPNHTQPLELSMFDIMKSFSLTPMTGVYSRQSARVRRIFDAWQRARVPHIIIAAFRSPRFVPFERDGKTSLKVDFAVAT